MLYYRKCSINVVKQNRLSSHSGFYEGFDIEALFFNISYDYNMLAAEFFILQLCRINLWIISKYTPIYREPLPLLRRLMVENLIFAHKRLNESFFRSKLLIP